MSQNQGTSVDLVAPPEIYEAIGRIASAWALIEHAVDYQIWALADVDDEHGACITAHIQSLNRRLMALIALVQLRGGDDTLVRDLNRFSTMTDSLAKDRNRVVHDPWITVSGQHGRFQITAERVLVFKLKKDGTAELDLICDKITAAYKKSDQISDRFIPLQPLSRQMQR